MPNRILRDWTDSYHVEQISADAERLFARLIMKADDFGRYHADPRLVLAGCFPLLPNVTVEQITKWMLECSNAELVVLYEVNGKPYLSILDFRQRLRRHTAKFPQMDGQPADWCPSRDRQLTVNRPSSVSQVRHTHTHTRDGERLTTTTDNGPSDDRQLTARATTPPPRPSPTPPRGSAEGVSATLAQKLSALKVALAGAYKRRNTLCWPPAEETLMAEIVKRPDAELELREILQGKVLIGRYFPQSVLRLLENWDKTLDEVRTDKSEPKIQRKSHDEKMIDDMIR